MNRELVEALQFYIDNDLDEAIVAQPQNHFNKKIVPKIEATKPAEEKKSLAARSFIKSQLSTDQAISALAKKFPTTQPAQTFQSLNEIVAQAQKGSSIGAEPRTVKRSGNKF